LTITSAAGKTASAQAKKQIPKQNQDAPAAAQAAQIPAMAAWKPVQQKLW